MLDPATGTLHLAASGIDLAAGLTRAAFDATPLGARARVIVANGDHESVHAVAAAGELDDVPFHLDLEFYRGRLMAASLYAEYPPFGGDPYADWSRAREEARRAYHDAWLAAAGVEPGEHGWGSVESAYDSRGAHSVIVLRWGWEG